MANDAIDLSSGFIDNPPRRPVDDLITQYSLQNGVDPDFARRVVNQESRGHANAVSPKGAQGLMQLMPGTAKQLGVTDPFDVHQNLNAGTKYLRQQLDEFGDPKLALAAYNAGPGAVRKFGNKVPPYAETQNYVKTIGGGYTGTGYADGQKGVDLSSGFVDEPQTDLSAGFVDEPKQDAAPVAPVPPAPPKINITASDAAWHFGVPVDPSTLSLKARQVLRDAVAEDQRKKGLYGGVEQPNADYQNSMRAKAGLKPLGPQAAPDLRATLGIAPPVGQVLGEQTEAQSQARDAIRPQIESEVRAKYGQPQTASGMRLQTSDAPNVDEATIQKEIDDRTETAAGQIQWESDHRAEIDRQTEEFRKGIQQQGGVNKWLAEIGSQGASGLVNLAAGAIKAGGRATGLLTGGASVTDDAANRLRISAEAAQRAALAEGADRNTASRFAQNISAGLISSAPAVAAMGLGLPAPLAFAGQSGLEAVGTGGDASDIAKAALHGGATGAAFEIPGIGEGATRVLSKAGAVGLGSTGVELAAGQPIGQALTTGATQGLMAGAGELGRNEAAPDAVSDAPLPNESLPARDVQGWWDAQQSAVEQRLKDARSRLKAADNITDYRDAKADVARLQDQFTSIASQRPAAAVDEPVHHSQFQPRNEVGQFDGPPVIPPPEEQAPSVAEPQLSENGNAVEPSTAMVPHQNLPQLVRAEQVNPTQIKLEFTRAEGMVSDADLKALFPEYDVTIRRVRPFAYGEHIQQAEITFHEKGGIRQVKAPADFAQRLGLNEPMGRTLPASPQSVSREPEPLAPVQPQGAVPTEAAPIPDHIRQGIEDYLDEIGGKEIGDITSDADTHQHRDITLENAEEIQSRMQEKGVKVTTPEIEDALYKLRAEEYPAEIDNLPARIKAAQGEPNVSETARVGDGSVSDRVAGSDSNAVAGVPAVEAKPAEPSPVVDVKTRESSFPKTLEASGRIGGTDRTYEEVTNEQSRAEAKRIADEQGSDKALETLKSDQGPGATRTALGIELIDRFSKEAADLEASGDNESAALKHSQAIEAANRTVANLTKGGQEVQAASTATRYTPTGATLEAVRSAQKGGGEEAKVSQADVATARDLATKHEQAEARIAELEKQLAKATTTKKPVVTTTKIGMKLEPFKAKLDKAAEDARARLAGRVGVGKGGEVGASIIPLDIADLTIIGASKLAKGGINFAQWSAEMISEFGESIRPQINAIFRASKTHLDEQRKTFKESSAQRSAFRQLDKQGEVSPTTIRAGMHDPAFLVPTLGRIQELRAEKSRAQVQRRQARVDLERHFKAIENAAKDKKLAIVNSVLREGLLQTVSALRVGAGMVSKQIADTAARAGEGALDAARVGARRLIGQDVPRTATVPAAREAFHVIKYLKNEGLPGVADIIKGGSSPIMKGHGGPTGNPYLDVALTPIMHTLGAKEQIVRSWAYSQKQFDVARTLAENDRLDGLIKRSEVNQRTQDYLQGKGAFDGSRNQKYAESFAPKAAEYEARSKAIIESMKGPRGDELKTSPKELMDSLAQQFADRQVYANPSRIQDRLNRLTQGSPALEVTQAFVLPFVKRPANAIADLLTTYTGLRGVYEGGRAAIDTARVIRGVESKWQPSDSARLQQAITRGGAGYGLVALGAILGARGLMTPGQTLGRDKSKNLKFAEGYKPGAIHIGDRFYPIQSVPFIGWLMTAGATLAVRGPSAVPGAVGSAILEHPLLRFIESAETGVELLKGEKPVGKTVREAAGSSLARTVPSVVRMVGESSDTKQRDTRDSVLAPAMAKIPGLRQHVPVSTDVLNREVNKDRFSTFDPSHSVKDTGTEGTREMIRLGLDLGKMKTETQNKSVAPENLKLFMEANPRALSAVEELIRTSAYKQLNDEERRDLLRKYIEKVRTPYERLRTPTAFPKRAGVQPAGG